MGFTLEHSRHTMIKHHASRRSTALDSTPQAPQAAPSDKHAILTSLEMNHVALVQFRMEIGGPKLVRSYSYYLIERPGRPINVAAMWHRDLSYGAQHSNPVTPLQDMDEEVSFLLARGPLTSSAHTNSLPLSFA
jgi:hypothetical protein